LSVALHLLQHKHKLEKEHRASDILDRIVARKTFLSEHYADEHGCGPPTSAGRLIGRPLSRREPAQQG
jgi:hypothetical protein